jgi:hypothetical protein
MAAGDHRHAHRMRTTTRNGPVPDYWILTPRPAGCVIHQEQDDPASTVPADLTMRLILQRYTRSTMFPLISVDEVDDTAAGRGSYAARRRYLFNRY